MSRFNLKTTSRTKTVNLAGGEAYIESPKLELVSLVLTSFVKDKFYESADDQLKRLRAILSKISDKTFAAKTAIYARNEFGMRSITHALLAEIAKSVKGEKWTKKAIEYGTRRPDDLLEIVSYYINNYGKPIPNSLKKGVSLALKKFDEYQLAKYKGDNKETKLVDILNLVHPKPGKENSKLFKRLVEGRLKTADTWETKLTKAGQSVSEIEDEGEKAEALAKEKKGAWKELVKENKLGYFALLRNLRNILEQGDAKTIDLAAKQLVDEKRIHGSLVLPFRFTTALKELASITGSRKLIEALSDALDISLKNVPKLPGKTLVVLDESGSMSGKPIEIGSIFAAVLYKANDADLVMFAEDARFQAFNTKDSTITIAKQLEDSANGGGTNFDASFELITEKKKKYDRIIILSDMQGWMSSDTPVAAFNQYKKATGTDPFIYSFDLNGHGSLQFPERNVFCIAGFSDKIFDAMKLLEEDRNALIKKIEAVKL